MGIGLGYAFWCTWDMGDDDDSKKKQFQIKIHHNVLHNIRL